MPDLLESPDSSGRSRALTARTDPVAAARAAESGAILRFEKVSKWYGGVIGVNDVTLQLGPGITALVGANGAGKSTLLRLAAGQLRTDIGNVRVCGISPLRPGAKAIIGYMPASDRFYEDMSGRTFVATLAEMHGYSSSEVKERTRHVLEQVGMAARSDRPIRIYSKGMRQRIKLAQAILHEPSLLILDEPFAGIDPVGRQHFMRLFRGLAARGRCLLVSSHELDEVEKLTSHVALMAHGKLVGAGTLTGVRDLLDHHPLRVQITVREPRRLAALLWRLSDVRGVEVREEGEVIVRALAPRRFLQSLGSLILEERIDVESLRTLDDSADALLRYVQGLEKNV
jgi:ABC-2 type transport system ATP-binding protein